MAKYLDTSHISSELMELLKEAKERIILVTYAVQVNKQIQERLKTKSKLEALQEITLIYGNTKPKISELQWMSEIDGLKVWQKKNLHAKCFINEKKAIICSMNLYDYSQTTNVEMGFLITKEEDSEAYVKMMEDVDDLKINGERVKPWLANYISSDKTQFSKRPPRERMNEKVAEADYLQAFGGLPLWVPIDGKRMVLTMRTSRLPGENSVSQLILKKEDFDLPKDYVLRARKAQFGQLRKGDFDNLLLNVTVEQFQPVLLNGKLIPDEVIEKAYAKFEHKAATIQGSISNQLN